MSIMHFSVATAGGHPVDLAGGSRSQFVNSPATATAAYLVQNDGDEVTTAGGGSPTILNKWLKAGPASAYEVRMTMDSGTNFGGAALATWLNAGTTRSWNHTRSVAGNTSGTGTIEVRRASDGVVFDSASVILTAIVNA